MGKVNVNKELLAQYLFEHSMFNKRWTVQRIAEMLGVDRRTVQNYINRAKNK